MKRTVFLPILGFALGLAGLSTLASATPAMGILHALDDTSRDARAPVIKVHGCHRRSRWGSRRGWWHRHAGRYCDPIRTRRPHRAWDDYGYRPRPHRHPRRHPRNYYYYRLYLDRNNLSHRRNPYRPYINYRYDRLRETPRRRRNCVKDWHCVRRGPFGLKKKCFWRNICS